jgi:hypothetical protein
MDNFWKWLKKANARAVFFCLLAVLLGVVVKWTWKLMSPIQMTVSAPAGAGPDQAVRGLGLLAYLEAQREASTNRAPSLFFSPDSPLQAVSPPPAAGTAEPPRNTDNAKPVKPPPRPVKQFVTLTYRGMYVGGDGAPMALIGDSKTGRATFYPLGASCFGLTLKKIEPETLSAGLTDGSDNELKRGVPQAFPEGNHVD